MRVSAINILLITACGLLAHAHEGNGQSLDQRLTIGMDNESLEVLFQKLETQTRLSFVFDSKANVIVSFPVAERSVKEVLELALENSGFTYRVLRKSIAIVPRGAPHHAEIATSTDPGDGSALIFPVTGIIIDGATQLPMAGVNIIVKGTSRGTSSDANGKYAIDASSDETLIFSFIGYKTMEVSVGQKTIMDMIMYVDATTLQAVNVVGTNYFSTTKAKSTMNVAKVMAEDINRQPVTSPLMALQGRMAGVDVTPYNGTPGAAIKIQIRGQNSLRRDGGYPLYIVDGVPIDPRPVSSPGEFLQGGSDPLGNINPNNIKSIEVLKDADATAIYGSRGANGVIIVTTKSPDISVKTDVDISVYTGVGKMTNRLDLLNTEEYLMMRKEAIKNDNATIGTFDFDVNNTWDTTRYTNWQNELLGGSANILDVQGGISAGNTNTTFRFSGGFHKEAFIFPGDFGFKRITSALSLNHQSDNNKLKVNLSLNYGQNNSNLFSSSAFMNAALLLAPNSPAIYNERGELNWQQIDTGYPFSTWYNPLAYLKNTQDVQSGNLIANSFLSYAIANGLEVKANIGFSDFDGNDILKRPIAGLQPELSAGSTGSSTFTTNKRKSWIIEPQVSYDKTQGRSRFLLMTGATFQSSMTNYTAVRGSDYTSDVFLSSILAAPTKSYSSDENTDYKYMSAYTRIGYEFKDRYIINLTGRRDGSSRFGPNNRFGNFGAVGAAWIFSQESLIQRQNVISFGKIRGSYGITGSDQIGDYQFYDTYSLTPTSYEDYAVSLTPTSLFNPNFKWENTTKLETTTELGFFNNRISIEATWYRNSSSNQLVNYRLPSTTGFSGVLSNLNATVENSGFEFLINTINIEREYILWKTSLNITVPKNQLVKFEGIEDSPYATIYKVGEPLSIQRLYTYKGVNPQNGLHEIVDLNDDGSFNDSDKQFMRPVGRKVYGGLINTLTYKRFELSFLFQYSKSIVNGFISTALPGSSMTNQLISVLGRWQNEGDISSVGKFSAYYINTGFYSNYIPYSDVSTKDVYYLRLKTLSIEYKLPNDLINKVSIKEASLNLQAQNLLTFTDYGIVLDPETNNSLPPLKMITAGIQLKF